MLVTVGTERKPGKA